MITSIQDLVTLLKQHRKYPLPPPYESLPSNLPSALANIYREFGAETHPFKNQDKLLPLSELSVVDGMLEFAIENQGVWTARCPVGISDPPVYTNAAETWIEGSGFEEMTDSLNAYKKRSCAVSIYKTLSQGNLRC
jgi:hypothetical protein